MKKEDVLELCENDSQIRRVNATYSASKKFNTECVFDSLDTKEEVRATITKLEEKYNKRAEAKKKVKAKKEELNEDYKRIIEQVKKAMSVGFTIDELCELIENQYKEKYNADIQKKIDELEAKTKAQLEEYKSQLV